MNNENGILSGRLIRKEKSKIIVITNKIMRLITNEIVKTNGRCFLICTSPPMNVRIPDPMRISVNGIINIKNNTNNR